MTCQVLLGRKVNKMAGREYPPNDVDLNQNKAPYNMYNNYNVHSIIVVVVDVVVIPYLPQRQQVGSRQTRHFLYQEFIKLHYRTCTILYTWCSKLVWSCRTRTLRSDMLRVAGAQSEQYDWPRIRGSEWIYIEDTWRRIIDEWIVYFWTTKYSSI